MPTPGRERRKLREAREWLREAEERRRERQERVREARERFREVRELQRELRELNLELERERERERNRKRLRDWDREREREAEREWREWQREQREREQREQERLLRQAQLRQQLEAPPGACAGGLFLNLSSLMFLLVLAALALELVGWFMFLGLLVTILAYLLLIILPAPTTLHAQRSELRRDATFMCTGARSVGTHPAFMPHVAAHRFASLVARCMDAGRGPDSWPSSSPPPVGLRSMLGVLGCGAPLFDAQRTVRTPFPRREPFSGSGEMHGCSLQPRLLAKLFQRVQQTGKRSLPRVLVRF
ncbi:hypothetical protein DFH09DRAFT_324461 [Mycena vulgaris]|nr:hypothetical protein DFH09DRAFT_324461 [Mycena vulgaris]